MSNDMTEVVNSILVFERDLNTLAGFTVQHDRLPNFFLKEKLPPHNSTFMVKIEYLDQMFDW